MFNFNALFEILLKKTKNLKFWNFLGHFRSIFFKFWVDFSWNLRSWENTKKVLILVHKHLFLCAPSVWFYMFMTNSFWKFWFFFKIWGSKVQFWPFLAIFGHFYSFRRPVWVKKWKFSKTVRHIFKNSYSDEVFKNWNSGDVCSSS